MAGDKHASSELFEVLKQKLAKKGVSLSECHLSTTYASKGQVGTENSYVFPASIQDNMVITAQSGAIIVADSSTIFSLLQLPILWGRATIRKDLALSIPFFVISPKPNTCNS